MKKIVILLMVVLSLALVSAGCGERNVESKNMDVPDGMTAVFAEDDFSGRRFKPPNPLRNDGGGYRRGV